MKMTTFKWLASLLLIAGGTWMLHADCDGPPPGGGGGDDSRNEQSMDPNEMAGPLGIGEQRYVQPGEWMNYTVFFENLETADVPAQEVTVNAVLSDYLDWSTFELGEIVFNRQTEHGLLGANTGTIMVPQRDTPHHVKITFDLNRATGAMEWILRSYDETRPQYGYWPEAVDAGFLPPNDETGRGEGHLSYRVKVRDDVPHGTIITASAEIIFDQNPMIPTDPAWWNTVAGNAPVTFEGADGMDGITLAAGLPYGDLPMPADRKGFTFGGWWTEPDGAGTRITSDMIVPEGGGTLYAHWVRNAYLDDPAANGTEPAPPTETTAYEGFLYDDDGAMRGTVTLSAKATVKADKKTGTAATNWTFSAKAILQSATVSFSAKAWSGGVGDLCITNKTSEALSLRVESERFWGTLSGGKAGGTFHVDGARNVFADKKSGEVKEWLDEVRGYYTAVLVCDEGTGDRATSAGYLTLTVGNLGSVKIAGKLSDGTSVSGSAKLLKGLNADGWYAVPFHKALYSKKGGIGGLLWLNPQDRVFRVDRGNDWLIDWMSAKPGSEFAVSAAVCGGWFGTGMTLETNYTFGVEVGNLEPLAVNVTNGAWMVDAFPQGLSVTVAGAKLSLPKATTPLKPKRDEPQVYDYDSDNPSGAKLTYTAKTGLFKGAFKLYYDGVDTKDALQHKTVSVSYVGVMTPTRDEAFVDLPVGLGTGTATINKRKTAVLIWLE